MQVATRKLLASTSDPGTVEIVPGRIQMTTDYHTPFNFFKSCYPVAICIDFPIHLRSTRGCYSPGTQRVLLAILKSVQVQGIYGNARFTRRTPV
ncbi:unnamed protein product [Caenorhabditis auriculariae]|uniref:Uncharacterized protein n=1 Tax=Caenorhabditis auriculariae TaxID=2777116 RepID=A0A8S1HRC1_9PELO|nr:unnamed protein product [Caenorhabditis auriculariae]